MAKIFINYDEKIRNLGYKIYTEKTGIMKINNLKIPIKIVQQNKKIHLQNRQTTVQHLQKNQQHKEQQKQQRQK